MTSFQAEYKYKQKEWYEVTSFPQKTWLESTNLLSEQNLGVFLGSKQQVIARGLCNVLMARPERSRGWTQATFEKPNFQSHSSFDGKNALRYVKFLD